MVVKRILVVAVAGLVAGCGLDKQVAPSLTGPSELSLSLAVTATPDIITQDGVSTSTILVVARDTHSQPMSGVNLRVETMVGSTPVDFGTLSSKIVSTGGDGRAALVYRAPPPPPATVNADTILTVLVTPVGSDFSSALTRSVLIRLARPGVILPPNGMPVPRFFFSPAQPREFETVIFNASASTDDGEIVAYNWNFGDGSGAEGMHVGHAFSLAGTYNVVLTVTDNQGLSASTPPTPVVVSTAAAPVASFVFSPTDPMLGPDGTVKVFFNASASRPSPGFQIVKEEWDFGDGTQLTAGHTVEHTYRASGVYTVVLTVFDSSGQKATASQTVTVAGGQMIADFVFSPTDPAAGTAVNFNATTSRPTPGFAIVKYEWAFGDGTFDSGPTVSKAYASAGTYAVVLTIEDSSGAKMTVSKTVAVSEP